MNIASTAAHKETEKTEQHPVSLALFDYAPVLTTAAAHCYLLTLAPKNSALYTLALVSLSAVFLGGFSKATWKTINAFTAADYRWMSDFLFIGLPLGMAGMAAYLYQLGNPSTPNYAIAYAPLVLTLLFYPVCWRLRHKLNKWFLPMVLPLTISTIAQGYFAFSYAQSKNLGPLAWCFIASIGVSVITSAVSRKAKNFSIQWVMELSNTGAGVLLLIPAMVLAQG